MADLGQETKIDGVFGGVAFNNQVENAVENTAENIQNAGTIKRIFTPRSNMGKSSRSFI